MGQVLAEYEGTKLGTFHTIQRGADGVVFCSCWAWKKNRHCKHLDRFFSSCAGFHKQTLPTPVVVNNPVCLAINSADEMINVINDPTFWNEEEGKSEDSKDKTKP